MVDEDKDCGLGRSKRFNVQSIVGTIWFSQTKQGKPVRDRLESRHGGARGWVCVRLGEEPTSPDPENMEWDGPGLPARSRVCVGALSAGSNDPLIHALNQSWAEGRENQADGTFNFCTPDRDCYKRPCGRL